MIDLQDGKVRIAMEGLNMTGSNVKISKTTTSKRQLTFVGTRLEAVLELEELYDVEDT